MTENNKAKQELLDKAKYAYYNTGEEILSDLEYDVLEEELGLENENYVGSKQGNYTIKHSLLMGSLSKVQVKDDNYEKYADEVLTYTDKCNHTESDYFIECTPKLDGCSFSAEFGYINGEISLLSVATRGNGNYGTDISHLFIPYIEKSEYWLFYKDYIRERLVATSSRFVIRGEVIISKSDFLIYCANEYSNPRAYVSGVLGRKAEDITAGEMDLFLKIIHFVCYDFRILYSDSDYKEINWAGMSDDSYNLPGEKIDRNYVRFFSNNSLKKDFEINYNFYSISRYEFPEYPYPIDGVVFKPIEPNRLKNFDRVRPLDCVALKFKPMLSTTKIDNISWAVKKTGEYFPTAILSPIKMPDGKTISKASLHNYNYVIGNSVGIGSEVEISLAGDIIPFVYKVISESNDIPIPTDSYASEDGKHLYKIFDENSYRKNKFLSSALALNINLIGQATAEKLYDIVAQNENILWFMDSNSYELINSKFGYGKSTTNIIDSLEQFRKHISIQDIIKSFCFPMCGEKASEVCAKIISNVPYSVFGLPKVSYEWALDKNSESFKKVMFYIEKLNAPFLTEEKTDDKTPIIMTGNPAECCSYSTKGEWLKHHSQYKETTSWKEAKILFTNDLDSKTSKMEKAKKLKIDILKYYD